MKLKAGIHILILTMVFFLTACSANDKSEAEPTIKEDTIISGSDTQTKRIENELEEQNELEDQPTNREEVVDREQDEDRKKETKGGERVVASVPEPAEDVDSTSDQQEEDRTLEQLLDDGFTVIEEQSFWMDTDYWGHVRFVAGYYIKNKVPHLNFYIVSSNQLVLDTLPESFPNNPNLRHINAVSFRDLNDDGEKDIIIIGEYVGGDTTKPAASATTRASVYFYSGQSYIQLPWYNDLINRSGKNETVSLVVKEGERILNLILTPKTRSADDETEFDRMAPHMCSKELFNLGDTEYASIYDSLIVFSSPSTYSESYLTSLIGDCFEQDTKLVLSNKPSALATKVNRYEQLVVDIVNDINHYNYIETGGGTMWTIVNAYSILDVHMSINKYARGKTLSDQGNIRTSINSLSSGWNQFQSEMNVAIKEGGFEDYDLMEWTGATLEDIVELEHRLDVNIKNLIELAANDKKAKDVVDLINNHFYSETY